MSRRFFHTRLRLASSDFSLSHLNPRRSLPPTSHALHRLPNLGNTIGPVSPSNPIFPHRSAEDLEKGGLALTITDDGEEEQSLGYRHKKLRIAVKVERDVMEQ